MSPNSSSSKGRWLRSEFKGREDELTTRSRYEKERGVSAQSLSSHFSRYSDRVPEIVKAFGKLNYYVTAELDAFLAWVSENSGTRTDVDIKQADIARLKNTIKTAQGRVETHRANLEKAQRDLSRHERQLKQAESDLEFLMQNK